MPQGVLYMIPVPIAEGDLAKVLPSVNQSLIVPIELFFVENIRSARRALRKMVANKPIESITFVEIGKQAAQETQVDEALQRILSGENAGVLSEAGCPGIADPGAKIARLAHSKGIRVVPLVGPSSLFLALMASGLNGQHFAFCGYLPRERDELKHSLTTLERRIKQESQSQLFIETPYRNMRLVEQLLNLCNPHTRLCIAQDITGENEFIATQTIAQWRQSPPHLEKLPTLFILGE